MNEFWKFVIFIVGVNFIYWFILNPIWEYAKKMFWEGTLLGKRKALDNEIYYHTELVNFALKETSQKPIPREWKHLKSNLPDFRQLKKSYTYYFDTFEKVHMATKSEKYEFTRSGLKNIEELEDLVKRRIHIG